MGNTNTPYIGKGAAVLTNPTTQTVFTIAPFAGSPYVAAGARTQAVGPVFIKYSDFAFTGSGVSNNINAILIQVRAVGRVTGGTTTNFSPSLLFNFGTTYPTVPGTLGTTIGALTPFAVNTASGNWYISATLLYDPISGWINGSVGGIGGGGGTETLTAQTAITPIQGPITPVANAALPTTYAANAAALLSNETSLFFTVGALFSASNANNVASLDAFGVEEL